MSDNNTILPYEPNYYTNCDKRLIKEKIFNGYSEYNGEQTFRTDVYCPNFCPKYKKRKR